EIDRTRVLPFDGQNRHRRHPRERRRFPADAAPCRSSPAPVPGAHALHEGAVRVDRSSVDGNRIRPRRAFRGNEQVELLAPLELRTRGYHVVLGRPAEARKLCRLLHLARRIRLRDEIRHQDTALRRPRRGLPDARHAGAVPRRPAADGSRRDRRIPGADVHPGQPPPPLPPPPLSPLGGADRRNRGAAAGTLVAMAFALSARERGCLAWFVIAVVVARVATLGVYPLMDTTEARYAEIARKMLETGDWLMPQFDYGLPF